MITTPAGSNPITFTDDEPSWVWPRAAYVHIPFCAHKCGYCDFASLAGSDHLADRYLEALEREMSFLGEPQEVETIFIGGGTPTRLNAVQLERLLAMVRRWFPLVEGGEWTVEANPGTLDAAKVDVLASGGVNRVSLGAQSFQPDLLRVLERNHSPEEVPRAIDLVRHRFPAWSFDLIFGVPGSTSALWADDLDQALALGPSHLSCYGLVFEKGTALWKQERAGLVQARRRGSRAVDVRAHDGPTGRRRAWRCTRSRTSPGRATSRGTTWSTGPTTLISASAWGRPGTFEGSGRATLATSRPTSGGSRRASKRPDPTETLDPEARARETAVLMLRRTIIGLDRDDFRHEDRLQLRSDRRPCPGETSRRRTARG